MKMGEDRSAFLDPHYVVGLTLAFLLCGVACGAILIFAEPSVPAYALPMIAATQLVQISMRAWFQRTKVTTSGIIMRGVLWEKQRAVRFVDLDAVIMRPDHVATTVTLLSSGTEPVTFRIFRFSVPHFERMVRHASPCEILQS